MGNSIRETIVHLFRQKKQLKDIVGCDSYYDLGVSSLTIIELQIGIEDALRITVPTSELMRLTTMDDWVEMYSSQASVNTGDSTATTTNAKAQHGDCDNDHEFFPERR